jgi:ABC-2 type transport system ATP-binding protein
MVKNLQSLGKTVFLTTHYMEEAEYLADQVAIITKGRIVADAPPAELLREHGDASAITFSLDPEAPSLPSQIEGLATKTDGRVVVHTSTPVESLHEVTGWALQERVELRDLSIAKASLEDVYLKLTGGDVHGETAE